MKTIELNKISGTEYVEISREYMDKVMKMKWALKNAGIDTNDIVLMPQVPDFDGDIKNVIFATFAGMRVAYLISLPNE